MTPAPSFLFLSHDNKIGDAIVLTGVFAPVKERWPDATIGVLCGQTNAVVYRTHPLVDFVHVTASRSVLARMLASLAARRQQYRQLVHFGSDVDSGSLRSIARLVHARECVLLFEPQRPLCARQHVLAGDWQSQHTCERHRHYLGWLGIGHPAYRYDLRLAAADVARADAWLAQEGTGLQQSHVVIACDASTEDRSLSPAWLQSCCTALARSGAVTRITLLCAGAGRHAQLSAMAAGLTGTGGVPVRVALVAEDAAKLALLRPGLSVEAEADTRDDPTAPRGTFGALGSTMATLFGNRAHAAQP